MTQPARMKLSKLAGPSGFRFRHWAARLTLIVACMAVVATSQAVSPNVTSEYEGQPLSLTTDAPQATRHLVIQVSAPKSGAETAEVDLKAQVTARWQPVDPASTVKPSLRVRLFEGDPSNEPGQTVVLEEPGQPVTVETQGFLSSACKLEQGCTWDVLLGIELQEAAAAGFVDVEWKVVAAAYAVGTSEVPEGFEVKISEP